MRRTGCPALTTIAEGWYPPFTVTSTSCTPPAPVCATTLSPLHSQKYRFFGAVNKYLQAARRAALRWPLPEELSDTQLRQLLFPDRRQAPPLPKVLPDFARIHQELKRKGVTRYLLWQEYAEQHPKQHYSYTRYAELYQDYQRYLRVTLRQTHRAGEKLFVDYAGPKVEIIDPQTGEVRTANIFVAVLGASSFTYAEASWSQNSSDWCSAHVRAFEFFGGVPELVIPDYVPRNIIVPYCVRRTSCDNVFHEQCVTADVLPGSRLALEMGRNSLPLTSQKFQY